MRGGRSEEEAAWGRACAVARMLGRPRERENVSEGPLRSWIEATSIAATADAKARAKGERGSRDANARTGRRVRPASWPSFELYVTYVR